jgi:hypothetical protein
MPPRNCPGTGPIKPGFDSVPTHLSPVLGVAALLTSFAAIPWVASAPVQAEVIDALEVETVEVETVEVDPELLRRQLLLQPVAVGPEYSAPSLSPGVPSAFIAGWGDYFVGVSGATRGRVRDTVDGSLNLGFGIGDMAEAVAVELSLNIASLNRFGANGTFDAKVGRLLVNQPTFRLGASVGVVNVAEWGNDPKSDANPYGVLTAAWPLRPDHSDFTQTLQISAGAGGETFGYNGANAGGFASVGVELLPNVGLSAGWSGRGGNAGLSWVPFKRTPLTLSVVGADLFNQTAEGPVAVFSLSWGSNFRTAQF